MKYLEVKTILYNSEEITNIPDKWEESIPFMCIVNKKEMDTFLYWNTCEKLEIKLMIGIDKKTGQVYSFDKEKINHMFNVQTFSFLPIIIEDYDNYFSDKYRYEEIYETFSLSKDNYAQFGSEEYNLFKRIVGKELFDNFFSIVAKEYLSNLLVSPQSTCDY